MFLHLLVDCVDPMIEVGQPTWFLTQTLLDLSCALINTVNNLVLLT